jgi:hypothetical protein
MKPGWGSRVSRHGALFLLLWGLLAVGVLRAGAVLIHGAEAVRIPYESTRPETFILNGARQVADGLPLYLPLGEEPYVVNVYNPLTYLPAGLYTRWFGTDLDGTLFLGRVTSYVASLLLLLLLAGFVWHRERDWKAALLLALAIPFWHWPTLTDFYRFRPESPALFFTFGGVAAFFSATRYRLPLSAVLFFVALLFKQSFISAPIAVAVTLAVRRDLRGLLAFGLPLGGLLVLFFLTMFLATGRAHFDNTILSMAVNEVHPVERFLHGYLKQVAASFWGPILALPAALCLTGRSRKYGLLLVYFCVCLVWTFYSAGKDGASVNYYSELAILSLVIISISLGIQTRDGPLPRLLVLIVLCTNVFATTLRGESIGSSGIRVRAPDIARELARYETLPGRKLITHEGIAVRAGEVVGLDWYLLTRLKEAGLLSLEPVFRRLSEGHYDTVVLDRRAWTGPQERWLAALRRGPYEMSFQTPLVVEWRRIGGNGDDG